MDGTVERKRGKEEFDEWGMREAVSSWEYTKLGKSSRVEGSRQRAWEMAYSTRTRLRALNNRRN